MEVTVQARRGGHAPKEVASAKGAVSDLDSLVSDDSSGNAVKSATGTFEGNRFAAEGGEGGGDGDFKAISGSEAGDHGSSLISGSAKTGQIGGRVCSTSRIWQQFAN